MPLSTILPPQPIEWVTRAWMPSRTFNPASQAVANAADTLDQLVISPAHSRRMYPTTQLGTNAIKGYGGVGLAGVTTRWAQRLGRRCIHKTIGAVAGATTDGWRPPDWQPSFGPAANMSPGATVDPGSACGVFDWHISLLTAAAVPNWPDDTTPVCFLPAAATVNGRDAVPGTAAAWFGGFGVFANNDGAGGIAYEYVAWTSGAPGTILERVRIGSSIIPDVTLWNTFRFIIISAASGREARMSLEANGFPIVTDRLFDNVELQRPATAAPVNDGAMGLFASFGVAGNGVAGDQVFYSMDYKGGRFTPAGLQLQDE